MDGRGAEVIARTGQADANGVDEPKRREVERYAGMSSAGNVSAKSISCSARLGALLLVTFGPYLDECVDWLCLRLVPARADRSEWRVGYPAETKVGRVRVVDRAVALGLRINIHIQNRGA